MTYTGPNGISVSLRKSDKIQCPVLIEVRMRPLYPLGGGWIVFCWRELCGQEDYGSRRKCRENARVYYPQYRAGEHRSPRRPLSIHTGLGCLSNGELSRKSVACLLCVDTSMLHLTSHFKNEESTLFYYIPLYESIGFVNQSYKSYRKIRIKINLKIFFLLQKSKNLGNKNLQKCQEIISTNWWF